MGGKLIMHKDLDLVQSIVGIFYANWFLSVLLVFSLLASIIYIYAPKYSNLCWILSIIVFYALPSVWYLGNCKWLLPVFVIAIQLSRYRWEDMNISLFLPSIFVFIVCYVLFKGAHSLLSVSGYEYNIHYNLNIIIRSLAGISGTFLVVYLTKWLYKWRTISVLVEKLGALSLPLYVVHTQICDINQVTNFRLGNVYYITVFAVVLILISLAIYHFCSHNKYLKLLLFGERC